MIKLQNYIKKLKNKNDILDYVIDKDDAITFKVYNNLEENITFTIDKTDKYNCKYSINDDYLDYTYYKNEDDTIKSIDYIIKKYFDLTLDYIDY